MRLLLAHDAQYHTQNTSGVTHFITQPLTISLLFLAGVVIIGRIIQSYDGLSPLQRAAFLVAYFILAAVLSFNFAPATTVVAFTLALMTLVAYVLVLLSSQPASKSPSKPKR